jgi:hypothetical protein
MSSTQQRALDDFGKLLDWPKLDAWIASHRVPGSGPVTAARKLQGGLQNNIFLLSRGGESFIRPDRFDFLHDRAAGGRRPQRVHLQGVA